MVVLIHDTMVSLKFSYILLRYQQNLYWGSMHVFKIIWQLYPHTGLVLAYRVSYKDRGTDLPPCTDLPLLLSMYNSLPYDPFYLFYVSHPTLVNMMIYNMVDDILATISMLWLLFQCFDLNVYGDENLCLCWERERNTSIFILEFSGLHCTYFSNKSKSSQKLVIHLRLNIYVADWWKLYITLQMNTNKHYMYKDCHPIEIILA